MPIVKQKRSTFNTCFHEKITFLFFFRLKFTQDLHDVYMLLYLHKKRPQDVDTMSSYIKCNHKCMPRAILKRSILQLICKNCHFTALNFPMTFMYHDDVYMLCFYTNETTNPYLNKTKKKHMSFVLPKNIYQLVFPPKIVILTAAYESP